MDNVYFLVRRYLAAENKIIRFRKNASVVNLFLKKS